MIYPTIDELTKNKFNRYELAIATAKCARVITSEYTKQRELSEKSQGSSKDDKPVICTIDKEYREEKSVKNAITKIYNGSYVIVKVAQTQSGEIELI